MITTPTLRNCFRAEVLPDEAVLLLSEFGHFALTGRAHQQILALVDGERTADQIVAELDGRVAPEEVYFALGALERQGFVIEAETGALSRKLIWDYLPIDDAARERVVRTPIEVRATPDLDPSAMRDALVDMGLNVCERGDLMMVLASDYLRPELADLNAEALAGGKPWLLVKPVGATALIGPLFRPGQTGCWECLAQRNRGNREIEQFLKARGRRMPAAPDGRFFGALSGAVVRLAAFQLGRALAFLANPQLDGRLISLDLSTLLTTTHVLVKRPQCPACGQPDLFRQPPSPLALTSVLKSATDDGGHRSIGPEQTFAQLQAHISPITGIVKSLDLTHRSADGLVNVYLAGHNFAMKNDSLFFLRHNLRSKSCGKGMSDAQARTSAICEALERYCGVATGDEPIVRASLDELGPLGVHPNDCMNFSASQYENRQAWLDRGSPFQVVPAPFDRKAAIDWVPAWSFKSQRYKYVPHRFAYYGYPPDGQDTFCWADSNGCASGATLEEAILQGMLEVVERDAVAVWWYNRLARPAVDLDSFGEPYIARLRAHYAAAGREVWVLDVTHDFGVPVMVAVSRRIDHPVEEILLGFGAHLDARIAVLRALTEMNQFLPAVTGVNAAGMRDYGYMDPYAISWWKSATVANQPYLMPMSGAIARRAADYRPIWSDDVLADVNLCVGAAARLGLDTLVLDQSRPDVNLRVAKVIVPGARHFWARLAPGRLYDVPVRMGWLRRPLSEAELNPIPMFL